MLSVAVDVFSRCVVRQLDASFAVAVTLFGCFTLTAPALGETVTLQSGVSPTSAYKTQDAHVRNNPTGSGNVGTTDNNTRIVFGSLAGGPHSLRGLFSYPLTGIPTGATINSVEFRVMQVDADSPGSADGDVTVELRSLSRSFSEGAGVAGTGGATWNNTFGDVNDPMTLSDILTSATMNADPTAVPVPLPSDPLTWITTSFASTPSLVAAAQAQLDASQPFNFAMLLADAEATSGVRRIFRTTSNTELSTGVANRPSLIIDYTAPTGLSGDYNGDGNVNAADYTVWRDNLDGNAGSFAPGTRDPHNTGPVNQGDYNYWATNYGASSMNAAASTIPEPQALLLALCAASGLGIRRR